MIKPLIHDFFSSCFCPILLFLHALFPSEDRLAFQQSELAGRCSNCSMSVFFLSFSGMFKACDTLFLFSWPTVLCQQGSICGSRGTRCSSQGASLKGQRRTSGLSAVDRVPSVRPVLCVWETLLLQCPTALEPAYLSRCILLWYDKCISAKGMRINHCKPLLGEDSEKKGYGQPSCCSSICFGGIGTP